MAMPTASDAAPPRLVGRARARVASRLRRVVTASALALLAVLLIAATNIARLKEAEGWYSHTYEVMAELERLQTDIATLESSARGWGTLRDPAFREHYAEANSDLVQRFSRLQLLTRDNPKQQQLLQQLNGAYSAWISGYVMPLLRQPRPRDGAVSSRELEQVSRTVSIGRSQFDGLRAITDAMEAEESGLLQTRTIEQNSSQHVAALTLLFSAIFVVLLLGVLLYMLSRSTSRVLESNERLETEISEHATAQDELRASRANLTALIENTSDLIWSVDRDYKLSSYNRVFSRAMMQRFGEAPSLGQDIALLFVGEDVRWKPWYDRAFAGEHFRVEAVSERDGETMEQELSFSPITTDEDDGRHITGATVYSRDITERRKIERLKTEFISTVSHELRTPLTSIRGSLGLLRGGVAGKLPDAACSLVDIAANNADRLVRLINDILDVEKIESGKMEFQLAPLELAPLIAAAVEGAHGYAAEMNVRFQLRNELPAGARVCADPDRLTQVMDNLLSNAAKYSPEQGVVTITLFQHKNALRVSVHDDGPGVPPEFHSRIFSRFAQADSSDTRPKGGTGLGLSIVCAIIEKLGGTVDFDRTLRSGATFHFDLPEWHPEALMTMAASGERVLICEDDPDIAELLRLMLRDIGFESDIARNLQTARNLLHARSADGGAQAYRAMTLDLNLPDGDGASFIGELRSEPRTRELPIIVVSATATAGRRELKGEALDVLDWLEKPIDTARLQRAVRSAAENGQRSPGWRPRVLHVEDDADIVRVASEILKEDAELDSASSLAAARAKLARNVYDLVILDLALPDGDGLELLTQLNSAVRRTPVVVFSARELSQEDAGRTEAVLVKSRTSNETLLQTIQSLISKN